MPLNTAQAENAVLALLDDMATRADATIADAQQTRRDFARALVAAMADLIRTGTVTGTTVTPVAGVPTPGTIVTAVIS